MEDPANASFSPAGLSCLHVPCMCSSSQGAGCFGEGLFTSSATGIMIFLKALWLSWAHTHPGEEASTGISSLSFCQRGGGKPMLQSTLGWPLLTLYLMCLWPEIRKQELGKGTHIFLRTWSATRSMRLNMCLHAVLNCGHEESNGKVNRRETLWKWRKRENPPCQEQQLSAVPRRYGLTQSWLGIRKSRDWKGRPSHLHQSWKVTQKSEICNNGERLSTGHNHSQRR